MTRTMLGCLCVVTAFAFVPRAEAGCPGCEKIAKTGEGYCCGKGKIYMVTLASKKLFDALSGQEIDKEHVKCEGCKNALQSDGKCDRCNVGVAHGKAYHSMHSHALAKGKPVDAEKVGHCQGCKVAYEGNGKCTGCNVGFVAGRMFKNDEAYKAAKTAHAVIARAASAKCEPCAVAMVTDGKCEHCDASFKDGKKEG